MFKIYHFQFSEPKSYLQHKFIQTHTKIKSQQDIESETNIRRAHTKKDGDTNLLALEVEEDICPKTNETHPRFFWNLTLFRVSAT